MYENNKIERVNSKYSYYQVEIIICICKNKYVYGIFTIDFL